MSRLFIMSYKDTALSKMKGSTIASIFLGGRGSKKCYSDRSLHSLLIIITISKIQLALYGTRKSKLRVKSELYCDTF